MGQDGEYGSERLVEGAPKDKPTTTAANRGKRCRCGMGPDGEYGSGRPVEVGTARQLYHNGSKSQETLPVWNGAEWRIRLRKACRRGHCERDLPQRQQIAENTAGVEWGRMENTAQKGLSKGALRERPTTTAANRGKRCRCGMGRMENTAQRGLSKGLLRDSSTTTAANRGKRCRCGKVREQNTRRQGNRISKKGRWRVQGYSP